MNPADRGVTVAAAIVAAASAATGVELPPRLRAAPRRFASGVRTDLIARLEAADARRMPWLLGESYEAGLVSAAREAGAHYTPVDVARRLVDLVVPAGDRPLLWDPACGGGVFLLAAADALFERGIEPDLIVSALLWGTDVDPGAVAITEAALWWWGHLHGVDETPGDHLRVADPLIEPPAEATPFADAPGFDLVIGNPPFQGQLVGANVRSTDEVAALRTRWGREIVRPYTDTSSLFLLAGARALAPGGRLLMILPTSTLSARDAAGVRAAVSDVADLTGLWVAVEPVFEASVDVCAVVLRRRIDVDSPPEGQVTGMAPPVEPPDGVPVVARWRGRGVERLADAARSTVIATANHPVSESDRSTAPNWAPLGLAALGVPDPVVRSAGRLGSMVTVRAGFRDEYYGLVGHVVDVPVADARAVAGDEIGDGLRPLVTTGLIDPGYSRWGAKSARFARRAYQRPAVDLTSLETDPSRLAGRARSWVATNMAPKVVVATQTRVGEAAVDDVGTWVASTPALVVLARPTGGAEGPDAVTGTDPIDLWEVAAIICSPVGSVAALAASAGAARSGEAIRQSVTTVAGLPLPVDVDALRAGAEALRAGDRAVFLVAMAAAYDVADPEGIDSWWSERSSW